MSKKHAAGVPIALELIEGRDLVERTLREGERAGDAERKALATLLDALDRSAEDGDRLAHLMSRETAELMQRAGIRTNLTTLSRASWSSSSTARRPPSAPGTN